MSCQGGTTLICVQAEMREQRGETDHFLQCNLPLMGEAAKNPPLPNEHMLNSSYVYEYHVYVNNVDTHRVTLRGGEFTNTVYDENEFI